MAADSSAFSALSSKEYPGRVIALGRAASGEHNVIIYGLTGRSDSSRARVLERLEDGSIRTQVTSHEQLQRGNPSLLLYRCITRVQEQFLVSNGSQTDLIEEVALDAWEQGQRLSPGMILAHAFSQPHWVEGNHPDEVIDLARYEPDAPTYTPRISGVLGAEYGALSILKRAPQASPPAHCAATGLYSFPLAAGHGKLIATYQGINVPSGQAIPSFVGEPQDILLEGESPEVIATQVYDALGPKEAGEGILRPGADFRVAVAVLFIHRDTQQVTYHMINRKELEA